MDVAGRLPRLRQSVEQTGCDALLVTSLTNLRYLTGFTGSAAMLLALSDRAVLVTDGRYATQAVEQLAAAGVEADIEVGNSPRQDEILRAAASGVSRLGLEAGHVSWARQRRLATEIFAATELVPTEGLVETLRTVKDAGELDRMACAARIADEALAQVRRRLLDRPTEREFAMELDWAVRRLGADDVSFDTIVAGGPNAAKPHARPTDRRIEPGELLVLDFGALVDGYHSDMTRTLCVGPPATATRSRMVDVVATAQAAGVAAVRGGAAARDVDAACRDIIASAGWGDAFVHGTGHGVGLDIHEQPMLSSVATATLAAGSVVTVEPGVYLRGEGGVRIEDSLVVTADGCRHLTNSPKDLVID
ncbi:MAG: Xaa-Pro peptidase family protein [Actinobacteria bacterium]|nr:Xaa-Pro peptidase family protein [Actinomycetota bacterium]